jgi:hypothetical protein
MDTRLKDPTTGVPAGEIQVTLDVYMLGDTLADLVDQSPLTVEGTVESSLLPSRQPDAARHPTHIETDAVFLIDKFIKGSLPGHKIVIAEHGGTVGQLRINTGEPLLQRGDRMILFLQPDNRGFLKPIAGMPRYTVVGAWNGKFKVEKGKILVMSHSIGRLQTHQLEDHDAFLREVKAAVAAAKP